MTCAGIICEFDPFHNGHKYLIDKAREAGADAAVCVMSGDFTQRGEPSLWDKFKRAEAAVACGADLVLELPAVYAVNSADLFARGGIRILKRLGCIDMLAFGSECADIEKLRMIAGVTAHEPEEFSLRLRALLSDGLSYAAACRKALADLYSEDLASVLDGSNDILNVCYIRESMLQEVDMAFLPVKRRGASYGSGAAEGSFASAGHIRNAVLNGQDRGYRDLMPDKALAVLSVTEARPDPAYLYSIARHRILTAGPAALREIPDVSEGLEMRLIQAAQTEDTVESFLEAVSTRRYSKARISRILVRILLGIDRKAQDRLEINSIAYAKVLAFNDTGAKILKTASEKGDIGIVSNINKYVPENDAERLSLDIDVRSSDVYSILCRRSLADHSDRVRIPVLLK